MAAKYVPLDYKSGNTVLDLSAVMTQAAQALDAAATVAVASADAEALSTVAALWLRMADSLTDGEEEDDEDEEGHVVKAHKLGFHNGESHG